MEGPVLTSASSHRLRSAVSACAQPTHSYFSSSYLGTSFQCASHNSGGCIKKFHCFGKNGETSFLDKLNVTKKVKSSNDSPTSCKRHKIGSKNCLSHYCGLRIQQKSKQYNVKEVENLSGTETRTIYPTQFMIRKELLSKLTLNKNVTDSKRLENYLDSTSVNEGDNKKCKKVIINGKISPNIDKKNRSNDRCISSINRSPSAKTLNYCTNKCSKVKNKNNKKNSDGFLFGKNVDSNEERSDECYSFGVRDEENLEEGRNEKQEISKWQPKHVVTRRTAQIVR